MAVVDLPDPPPPPEAPRRVRLYRYQWIGMALLLVLPVLAIAGVFGETWRVEHVRGADFEMTVRYPDRYRYKQLNSIEIRIRNTSGSVLDTVAVAVDTALAGRFSTVRAIPSFTRPYEADLTGIEPGATALLVIELQGESYGRHRGRIRAAGRDTVDVPVSILIFP